MRHDLHVEGHAVRLRPVEASDAAFIVGLRARAGRFLNRGAGTIAAQREWLDAYFDRANEFLFVIEGRDGAPPHGLVGLQAVDVMSRSAEWGRWIIEPGSSFAVESALLVYRCAFDRLAMERVCCKTLVENAHVVSFHDSCGLTRAGDPVLIEHDGESRPAVVHWLTAGEWPAVEARLEPLAARIAAALAALSPRVPRS